MHGSTEATHAASFLVIDREAIVAEWERRVLADDQIPTARTLEPDELRDYVPKVLDTIANELRGEPSSIGRFELMRIHAALRRDAGYSLDETLTELAHLRDVLRLRADPKQLSSNRVIANALEQASAAISEVFGAGVRPSQ
jgi:hypothetical protein